MKKLNSVLSGIKQFVSTKDGSTVDKRIVLIFLISFIIRAIFAVFSYKSGVMDNFVDDAEYLNLARNFVNQGFFAMDISRMSPVASIVGPGIGWIMATVFLIVGESWLALFLVNAVVSSITSVLIYLIGLQVFSQGVGFWSGIWASCYILFIKYIPTAGKDIWIIFLVTLVVFLVIRLLYNKDGRSKDQWVIMILMALTFTLLVHVDERYLPFFGILIVFAGLSSENIKGRLLRSSALATVFILLMIPWLVRNYQVYDRVIIVSVRTADITDKMFGYPKKTYFKSFDNLYEIKPESVDSVIAGIKTQTDEGADIPAEQAQAMKDGIMPYKFSKFEQYFAVFINFWEPFDFNRGYAVFGYKYDGAKSLRNNLASFLTYGILLPFAFLGLYNLFKKNRLIALFLLSIIGLLTIIHVLFIPYTLERYRLPIDPLIILLGVSGIVSTSVRVKDGIFINKNHD